MAITMSGATVDTSLRDQLYSNTVNDVTVGGETANTAKEGGVDLGLITIGGSDVATGASLAGIDNEFEKEVIKAINDYIESITDVLGKLDSIASSTAFKGEGINKSLQTFASSVKEVASKYVLALRDAEKAIISGVHAAYKQQDTDISGNLNTDSSNLVEK